MIETIMYGLFGVCIACIGYLLRRFKMSRKTSDLVISALERALVEKVIHSVEAWAEKKFKETGEKVAGSEKMKKAIEELKSARNKLAEWGIKIEVGVDDEELKARIQKVFDEIKEKIHRL